MTPDTDADKHKTTRLYISPLDPSSLSRILPPEKQAHIRSASYHSIETFPEKSFAYLDLPADLARALRQKLNGSFLKGAKMRVEEARPEKRKRKTATEDAEEATKVAAVEERRSKRKRGGKPEEGLLKGLELPDGRKIKRGWADADGKKGKKTAAKDGQDTSLVFRTSLPPNVASNGTTSSAAAVKSKGKTRKSKSGEANIIEVKEGEQNSKTPTFLRSDPSKNGTRATNFVEGKGWVDEQGAVVEATVKKSRARKTAPDAIVTSDDDARNQDNDDEDSELSSELSSDSDSDAESSSSDADPAPGSNATATATPEVTLTPAPETDPETATTTLISRSRSSSAMPITSTEAGEKPAPSALETLFKRPADPPRRSISTRSKPLAPVKTFSFGFAGDTAADDDEPAADADESTTLSPTGDDARPKRRPKNLQIPPATPFTRGDLDARALRSAAPTPDTAAIGRRFRPWGREGSTGTASSGRGSIEPRGGSVGPAGVPVASTEGAAAAGDGEGGGGSDGEDGAEGDGEGGEGDGKEQNDFEKHFYEQRGEYNRAWKARKREAKKGARQAENRRGLRGKG